MKPYSEFIKNKYVELVESGFIVSNIQLNKNLFPFQRYCIGRALRVGRFALFEDCGLGKTIQQLDWANQVVEHTSGAVLILCPLAVVAQTIQEGSKFGISVTRYYEGVYYGPGIYIANYEQLSSIDADLFSGVVLDESSILKNFEGKTRNELIDSFKNTAYKLCCTATPSPNDPMELGNHAEFLGVMSRNQMLAMYFVHDGGDTAKWRLKGHSESRFWQWVSSWAIMMGKPHDIGFVMDGYDLPPLNIIQRTVKTQKRENWKLLNDMAVSATTYNTELRLTKIGRISQVADIVNTSPECFIVWVRLNEEADEVKRLIPDAVEVRGNMSPELKESRLLGFARGEFRVLVTKPEICAYGLNYQHCANQVFASMSFSFEEPYQAIRRSYRFGQMMPVNVYMITTDTMHNVKVKFQQKQLAFERMQAAMTAAINKSTVRSTPVFNRQNFQRPSWLQSLCKSPIN